ncbi:MAG: diguanylate cyclase [Gaiellaceae bacterium]
MDANGSPTDGDLSDRRPEATWAVELVLLLALVFAGSYLLRLSGASIREGVLLGSLALAGIAAQLAARRSSRLVRPIWWLVPAVCMLWLAGEGGRMLTGLSDSSADRQWLLSGVFALAAYSLLLLAALRVLTGSSVIVWSLGLLDAVVVAVALCAPWLELLVLPRLERAGGAAFLPQLLVPVMAGVVLVAASLAVYEAPVRTSWLFVLLTAIAAGFVGDLLAARHLLAGGGTAAALSGWEVRTLLVIVAAACIGGTVIPRERRLLGLGMARLAVVIVAYAAALTYAALAFERGKQLAGFAVASVISVLLMMRLLMHAIERHRHSEQLVQALREQEQLAVMDSLTGLYNRRFLDAELQLELDRGGRSQEPVGILLCDLDHFKRINDRYGHLVGDSVLREVARRLLGAVRNGDLVARYGGEEFVVLLPGGDKELLKEIGERCRRAFDEAPFYLPGGHRATVTISIGGACWPEDASSTRDLFEAADSALYRAKEQGRNRIRVSELGVSSAVPKGELATTPYRVSGYATGMLAEPDGNLATQILLATEAAVPSVECTSRAERMERWAELVARALGLNDQAQRSCALATRFHDVGKSALPESILIKHGPLTTVEWELVQEHPERGATLVELAPELENVAPIIREHHERFDGRGYPYGKSKDEISTEARIVACCDAWDAMRSQRPYAPAMTVSEARAELLAGRGTQFDPDVVMAFLMFEEADLDEAEGVPATPV